MRKAVRPAAFGLAGILMTLAAPALADNKAGFDAWSRGDYRQAVDAWRPAAIAGDADAQFNLGQAYKLGRGVPVDLAMAEGWYRKAAVQGHAEAEANYGLVLFQDGKRDQARPWLEKAVARGEPRAQLVLGTMLYNGDGVERDWPRAYALVNRAQSAGYQPAAAVLSQMDQYIPADDRQKGLVLSRQYEADAQRPQLPPDLAGQQVAGRQMRDRQIARQDSGQAMQGADLPPSAYDPSVDRRADPDRAPPPPVYAPPPVVMYPQPTRRAPPPMAIAPEEPEPMPARAPAQRVAGRGWRVQFGAFRDDGNAKALWQGLKARIAALGGLQPYLVRTGTLTKLQAGPLASSAEAARACAAVRSGAPGTPCVPVAP